MAFNRVLNQEQLIELKEMLQKGCGYTQCARYFNNILTKQRIQQYAKKWKIDPLAIRQEKFLAVKENEMEKKWGSNWHDKEWRQSDIYKSMRDKFRAKKHNAARVGIEFTISFGELSFPSNCPILNIPIDYFVENYRADSSPSFDRIDPSKGYVPGNVIIISWRANRIRNDGTAEEHRKIADFYQNKEKT